MGMTTSFVLLYGTPVPESWYLRRVVVEPSGWCAHMSLDAAGQFCPECGARRPESRTYCEWDWGLMPETLQALTLNTPGECEFIEWVCEEPEILEGVHLIDIPGDDGGLWIGKQLAFMDRSSAEHLEWSHDELATMLLDVEMRLNELELPYIPKLHMFTCWW